MDWDTYFFDLVRVASEKSKDRSTGVGAVIVGFDHEVRSLGYNGFPRGVDDDIDERHERPAKYLWTEHAERNAIFNAARIGTSLQGCSIYIDWEPCARCARAIIQAGIAQVVIDGRGAAAKKKFWAERWAEDCAVGREMLKEAGVSVRIAFEETE